MKIAPAVAAVSLVALAGCAGMQPSLNTQPTAAAAGGAYYCWKARLADEGSSLVCNWERSAADACRSNAVVALAKSNVSGTPQGSRRCENGEWLVTVTSR
jgi:hypothetical protein